MYLVGTNSIVVYLVIADYPIHSRSLVCTAMIYILYCTWSNIFSFVFLFSFAISLLYFDLLISTLTRVRASRGPNRNLDSEVFHIIAKYEPYALNSIHLGILLRKVHQTSMRKPPQCSKANLRGLMA